MSNKDLNAERRKLLASAILSMGFLHVNGFLQHAEVERIYARIRRYQDENQVQITEAQLESAGFTYNDEAKVINE